MVHAQLFDKACQSLGSLSNASASQFLATAKRILLRDASRGDAKLVVAAGLLKEARAIDCLRMLLAETSIVERSALWNQIAAAASLDMGDMQAATQYYIAALELEPQNSNVWLAVGEIHERLGVHRRAIAYYRRGLVFEDARHACSLKLTHLLLRRKNVSAAIQVLHSSLLRDRRSPVLNQELGMILERQANRLRRRKQHKSVAAVLAGAAECYRIVAETQTASGPYLALASIEQKLGRFSESVATYRRIVELDSPNSQALLHIANHDMEHGKIDEAVQGYERVLSIDPDLAVAHFKYSRSRKFKADEKTSEYVQHLLSLIKRTVRRLDFMQLHFAVAKVLDDSGNFDLAWEHYDLANRHKLSHSKSLALEKRKRPRSAKKFSVEDQIQFFTREYFLKTHHGSTTQLPIFIVGMPRSGTTLVEQILSSHPAISGAGELKDIERLRRRMRKSSNANPLHSRTAYPELLGNIPAASLTEIANEYLEELTKYQGQAIRVTDKMPTNFMHLGLIATFFPNATIVHCRRNPMDVFVSSYCQNLNAPFCDLDALVEYYMGYKRLMQHWNAVLPIPIYTVDYEVLVANPESETQKLVASTGLAWDDRCLSFNQNERAVRTPSKWQVRQPMYSSSIDRWKRFENHLQDVLSKLALDESNVPIR